jgi:site-specific DNA-methyltransferase (adenine-specific)
MTEFEHTTKVDLENGSPAFAKPVLPAVHSSVVYNEDCVEALKRFPDNYFDLAIVDPPYSETFNTDACANNKGKKGNYQLDTLNNHLPTDEYWEQLFRVSKNQIVWGGANWYGKYFGVGGLVWFKDNTGNYSPCEYAYQSINNHIHHYQYRWNGMLQQNMKDKEQRIHPTQKPVALYDWILQKFAKQGDLILDTHLGSGSSRIAAHKGGFNFIGYEISKDYYEAQEKRFKDFVSQLRLF